MGVAATLLLVVNIVYATSPVVTRLVLDDVPPITLALLRLVLGAAVLVPFGRGARATPAGQGARVFWMGALGFAAAFALSHWGIARSSATNAALLIVVEPLTLVVLGPLLLGERLTRREAAGAALAVAGAVLVVLNGVPGVTLEILPRWRGDALLILSGIAYASYSLLGHGADRHERHRDHRAVDRLGHAGDGAARRAGVGGRRAAGGDAVGGGGDALPGARDQRRRLSRLELGAGAGRGVAGGAVPHRAAGGRGAARRRRPGRGGHALHRARRRPRRPRPLDDGHRPALSVY